MLRKLDLREYPCEIFGVFFYEALEPEVVLYFSVFSYLLALIFDIFT